MAGVLTRRALPRRALLRGAGAVVALPWLDAMTPALAAAAPTGPARLGFFYVPNGMAIETWRAAAGGPCPALTGALAPLGSLRNRVTVVSGLGQPAAQRADGIGPHARAASAWLSGMPLTAAAGQVRGAITADQLAARDIGRHTRVASLELIAGVTEDTPVRPTADTACRTISWRGPDAPNPMAWDPRAVFTRLFGSEDDDIDGQGRDRSLLDGLLGTTRSLERRLGARDRAALADYLSAIRDVEKALTPSERRRIATRSEVGPPVDADERDPLAHAGQLLDLLYLAYRADLTRVATFMFGPEGTGQPGMPHESATHHAVAHRVGDPARSALVGAFERAYLSLFARFCERLQATPDGDATLLDRAVFLYGAGFSDWDRHCTLDLPLAVVGGANGALEGNRHVTYAGAEPEPMTNLLLSLLVKADVRVGRLGDSTGVLPGI